MAESKEQELRRLDLQGWLRVALLDLTGESRERIQTEIMTRYQQAFDGALARGDSEMAAHRVAMEELGDPWLFQSGGPADEKSGLDLDVWLGVATAGLTADSEARVRAEISAHYQDALDAAREAGRSEAEAARAAVAGLGDPEAARKQFRKAYLWQGDVDRLKALERWRTRTRKDQLQGLGAGICGGIICSVALRYGFGLDWSAPMSGLAPAFGLGCADLLNGIRARFVFSPPAQDAERRFRDAVT